MAANDAKNEQTNSVGENLHSGSINPQILDLVKEEYKALRAEIILCLERRITIISYGIAAMAVLTGAAAANLDRNQGLPSIIILGLVQPVFASYIFTMWIAETTRVRRASHYIWGIERKLSRSGLSGAMGWEMSLRPKVQDGIKASILTRDESRHPTKHYRGTARFFISIVSLSIILALLIIFNMISSIFHFRDMENVIGNGGLLLILILIYRAQAEFYYPKLDKMIDDFNDPETTMQGQWRSTDPVPPSTRFSQSTEEGSGLSR